MFPAIILFFLLSVSSFAQRISRADYQKMQVSEDTMKGYSWKIVTGINSINRFNADSVSCKLQQAGNEYFPRRQFVTGSKPGSFNSESADGSFDSCR